MGKARRKTTPSESGTRKRKKTSHSPEPAEVAKGDQGPTGFSPMKYDDIFHVVRLHGIKQLLGATSLYDVTFHVGPKAKVFEANRFPLISISKKLSQLIQECGGQPIVLGEGHTATAMKAIKKFAYGHDPGVNADNAVEVCNMAKLLEIEILNEKILEYIQTVLRDGDEKHLMSYLEQATTFQNDTIVKMGFESLQLRGGIPKFLQSESFCSLKADLLNKFLQLDTLPVLETLVWETVVRWAEFQSNLNGTSAATELKKVYHNVRFPLFDPAFFSTQVVPQGILSQEECLKMFTYLCNKSGGSDTTPFLKSPRLIWDMVAIKRFTKPPNGEWFHLENYVDAIGFSVDHAVALQGIGVYIGEGSTKCSLKLFQGTGEDRKVVGKHRQTLKSSEKSPEPAKLLFHDPIILEADESYEIELASIGSCSLKGNQGVSEVLQDNNGLNVIFNFCKVKMTSNGETNETTVKKGNLPTLYVRITSDM